MEFKDANRRVVVTGLGVSHPLGLSVNDFWSNLKDHQSAASLLEKPFQGKSGIVPFAGQIKEDILLGFMNPKELKRNLHRSHQLSLHASYQALNDSNLLNMDSINTDIGAAIGTGFGGALYLRVILEQMLSGKNINSFSFRPIELEQVVAIPSSTFKLGGPSMCLVAACATGNENIRAGYEQIKNGNANVMVTGSTESVVDDVTLAVYEVIRALKTYPADSKIEELDSSKASVPFDTGRDGFVASEGAGILVLENLAHAKKRGAKIYAEITGCGTTNDASHPTLSSGEGSERAMRIAIKNAGLTPEQIDYVKAHATSTVLGDITELGAISRIFQEKSPMVSSPKGYLLHNLGAAGSVEAVAVVKMIEEGLVISGNLINPEPTPQIGFKEKTEVNIPYPVDLIQGENKPKQITHALANGFGFGGINSSIVFSRYID